MGVGWVLFIPLPCLLLRGLGDALVFTLREDLSAARSSVASSRLRGRDFRLGISLLLSKLIISPASSKKSAPNKPAAFVGS